MVSLSLSLCLCVVMPENPQVLVWDRCQVTEVTVGSLGIAQQTYPESWQWANTAQLHTKALPAV